MTKPTQDTLTVVALVVAFAGVLVGIENPWFKVPGFVVAALAAAWLLVVLWRSRGALKRRSIAEPLEEYARFSELEVLHQLFERSLDDVPTPAQMKSWHNRNPKIFRVALEVDSLSNSRKIVAAYKAVPLKAKTVKLLERNLLTGTRFVAKDIATPKKTPRGWYIGDLVSASKESGRQIMADLRRFVRDNVDKDSKLFARGLTYQGFALLVSYGFQPISDCAMDIGCICVLQGEDLALLIDRLHENLPSRIQRPELVSISGADDATPSVALSDSVESALTAGNHQNSV